MMNAVKIATSVPSTQYRAIERARRRLHLKRSQVVQEALSMWLSAREGDERVAQYLRGYFNRPEDARGALGYARAWVQGIEPEDWR